MKNLLALSLCLLFMGCIIGVDLSSPEETVATWIRSYNDRDVKGVYATLSDEYILANGGEEEVKESIAEMIEETREEEIKYTMKTIGKLSGSQDEETGELPDIYLVRIDKSYVDETGTEKTEEIILNFEMKKYDGSYKIVTYWD